MADSKKANPYRWKNSWSQPLAMTDAVAKLLLLIEKSIITDAEFKQKLSEERAVYQRFLIRHRNEPRLTAYSLCTGDAQVWGVGLRDSAALRKGQP